MPSCFTLTRKGASEPASLVGVDEELCAHFGAAVHPNDWYQNWYNSVGFGLAVGHDWDKLREFFPTLVPVIDFLSERYDVNRFRE